MKRETKADRAAWTEYVDGAAVGKKSKYGNVRTGKYASKKEAMIAARLQALASVGVITDLREQVRFVLVEGQGKIRPICYIADFMYVDEDKRTRVIDVKGYTKNQVYRLKKKMMMLLRGIEIEEW